MSRTNPRFIPPDRDTSLSPNKAPERSLFESAAETVDQLRQLFVDAGGRPYRCWSVVVAWSGGEIGKGTERVVSETEILPTPNVDMRPMRSEMRPGGKVENGTIVLNEISPRFTEDDIRGLFHVQPVPAGHQAFIEVRHDSRDGDTVRRRYTVRGVPWRDTKNHQWVAKLSTEEAARKRNGELSKRQRRHDRGSI